MMKKITILGISCALPQRFPLRLPPKKRNRLYQTRPANFPQVDRNGDGKLTG